MAVDPNKQIHLVGYISDDGNDYSIGARQNHIAAAGMVQDASFPQYPQKWTPRCIHGVGNDGIQRATLVLPSPQSALFVDATGSFTIAGVGTFTKTGSTGEKRPRL